MSKGVVQFFPSNDFVKESGVRGDMGKWEPSLTRQEFAEECDINTIMERYEASGAITHVNTSNPVYMDVTELPDLRGAMDAMREASLAFYSLPAKVRREFDNDPQAFVDFAQAPENLEQMRTWGLAPEAAVEPPPVRVEVISKPANANEPPAPDASKKPA